MDALTDHEPPRFATASLDVPIRSKNVVAGFVGVLAVNARQGEMGQALGGGCVQFPVELQRLLFELGQEFGDRRVELGVATGIAFPHWPFYCQVHRARV